MFDHTFERVGHFLIIDRWFDYNTTDGRLNGVVKITSDFLGRVLMNRITRKIGNFELVVFKFEIKLAKIVVIQIDEIDVDGDFISIQSVITQILSCGVGDIEPESAYHFFNGHRRTQSNEFVLELVVGLDHV